VLITRRQEPHAEGGAGQGSGPGLHMKKVHSFWNPRSSCTMLAWATAYGVAVWVKSGFWAFSRACVVEAPIDNASGKAIPWDQVFFLIKHKSTHVVFRH
jgi:hypothetical protein